MYFEDWVDRFSEAERRSIVKAAKITIDKPEGAKALDYLINVRKLSKKVIDDFDIGYCPKSVNHQVRGRIITPIYDAYKNLVVISTRLPYPAPLRFWHETFNKGSYLYGLYNAKESIIRSNKVILVEGEFDVSIMHTNGFTQTVGICGSALTLFQVALLSKYASFFYLLFDGDGPGQDAIDRAIKMYKEHFLRGYGIHFIPVRVPNQLDPDDFIKQNGRIEMKKILVEAYEEYKILI